MIECGGVSMPEVNLLHCSLGTTYLVFFFESDSDPALIVRLGWLASEPRHPPVSLLPSLCLGLVYFQVVLNF